MTTTPKTVKRNGARSRPAELSNKTEALYEFLVESLTEYAVFAVSPTGTIISWNSGGQHVFGYAEAEMVGVAFDVIFTAEDRLAGSPASELTSAASGGQTGYDRWHLRKDGSRFWGTNTVQPLYDETGALLGFTKLVRDTTQSHLALEKLSESEQRLRLLIESVNEYAIFSIELDGTIASWNSGAQRTFGYTDSEIVGTDFARLYGGHERTAGVPASELDAASVCGQADHERWLVRNDGSAFFSSVRLSPINQVDGILRGYVIVAHDITELHRSTEEMRRQATTDGLTNLNNRATFFEHVARSIASLKRRPANKFAVLFIDLDHFKEVNDTFGHMVADGLLEATARRLERCARSEDVIARLGGDEFAILLNGINGIGDAVDAADRIGAEMSKRIVVDAHEIDVTASVGIALGSRKYTKPEHILRDADTAMYAAKTRGRARAVIYDSAMGRRRKRNVDIEADLGHAVTRNELRLAYQPIMRLRDRSLAGFESLVRWQHPRRGLLQPTDFIALAEESDLIIGIDRWVFEGACRQLAAWHAAYPATGLTMSVNFSSKEFLRVDLPEYLARTLAATGADARALHIEITETAIGDDSPQRLALIARVRELGFKVHVDDFGTAFSTLASIQHMPVDALKLDRSFVAAIDSPTGRELVRTIISLAHNLGLVAIAEGIEIPDQYAALDALGCEFGQGVLFGVPRSAAEGQELLRAAAAGDEAWRPAC